MGSVIFSNSVNASSNRSPSIRSRAREISTGADSKSILLISGRNLFCPRTGFDGDSQRRHARNLPADFRVTTAGAKTIDRVLPTESRRSDS